MLTDLALNRCSEIKSATDFKLRTLQLSISDQRHLTVAEIPIMKTSQKTLEKQ